MKKLAARDFEDLLQVAISGSPDDFIPKLTLLKCAIPVFEDLLPRQHGSIIRKLLFELATWHALAKLRLHTESTLYDLENSTTRLGQILRKFNSVVCANYETKELPSEIAARGRRAAAARSKKAGKTAPATTLPTQPSTTAEPPNVDIPENVAPNLTTQQATHRVAKPKLRNYNMYTYKLHSLPSYPRAIREQGTTDGYNSQTV